MTLRSLMCFTSGMRELGFIPAQIVGGESIWVADANTAQGREDIVLEDYTPADGYTLAYTFDAPTPLSVDADANGGNTGWTLDITGAQTLTLPPGRVPFVGMITHTSSGRTFAADRGGIVVEASPARTSDWTAVLTAIEAALLTVATNPHGNLSMDGMSVSYRGSSDLIALRDYAKREQGKDLGRRNPRRILTRFV